MVNTFPDLLTYSFFAPTILRMLVALSFFYIAYAQAARRKEIAHVKVPILGHLNQGWVLLSSCIIGLTGIALFLGWHTQLAAIVGAVVVLKHAIYAKKYPRLIPLCRLEYVYLFVILLTLLISGAGVFAIDVRL
jgi:hypothetical protein